MVKKPSTSSFALSALLLAAVCAAPAAQATSITVDNASFEAQSVPLNNWAYGITDWVTSGGIYASGVWQPGTAYFTGGVTDGVNSAWLDGGTAQQTLAATLQANSTYTLQVDVGDRKDVTFKPYTVSLLAGSNVLATESSLVPNNGFLTSVVSFTTLAANPYLGQALSIRLTSGAKQVNFDNVRLDVVTTAVPEPTSVALFLAGLGWMGMATRRRNRTR
jgi:hypothetical protein